MRHPFNFFRILFIPCEQNSFRPQFFESGIPIVILGVIVFLKFLHFSLIFSLPATSFFPQLTKEKLIELTNRERQLQGLPQLKENQLLDTAALLKGQDMLARNYFSHTDPAGNPPWYWIQKTGYHYLAAGENLAIGFLDAKEVIDAWNSSPSHRANIVNPNYTEIGIAVLQGTLRGTKTTLVVQYFGLPSLKTPPPGAKKNLTGAAKQQPESLLQSSLIPPLPHHATTEEQLESAIPKENTSILGEESNENIFTNRENLNALPVRAIKAFGEDGTQAVNKLAIFVLSLFTIAFALMVFIKFEIQHKDLIFRAIILILFTAGLFLLDREFLLALIPHQLTI
jgi:uncharacterized protein YkwD